MSHALGVVAQSGRDWQEQGSGWEAHTLTRDAARARARGYLEFLRVTCGWKPPVDEALGLDIGAGAGHLALAVMAEGGIPMTASEWSEAGLRLLARENPELERRMIDITAFEDENKWDVVICRELYPFTRVNAFTDQCRIVSQIIESLKPGGVFLLIGSDVNSPHCVDYVKLIEAFRKDPRVSRISSPHLEPVLCRVARYRLAGKIAYRLASSLAEIWTWNRRRKKLWAAIRVIAFVKGDRHAVAKCSA